MNSMEDKLKEAVKKTLEALFKLEDLRQIWRDTAPMHELTSEQKKTAKKLTTEIRDNMNFIFERLDQ